MVRIATAESNRPPEASRKAQEDASQIVHLSVPWEVYEGLVSALEGSHVRMAYDGATLEIMSPAFRHEKIVQLILNVLLTIFSEWEIDYVPSGMTTFKTRTDGGFEGDASFYLANAGLIKGRDTLDLSVDPAPDLILEVDISNRRMDKKSIYEGLGVGEFWRYDDERGLEAHALESGAYVPIDTSRAVRGLPLQMVTGYIKRLDADETYLSIIDDLKGWLRENRRRHDLPKG